MLKAAVTHDKIPKGWLAYNVAMKPTIELRLVQCRAEADVKW
jgi:hypothetical protein